MSPLIMLGYSCAISVYKVSSVKQFTALGSIANYMLNHIRIHGNQL